MNITKTQVWSYGGGRQSAAIAVLIKEGVLPKPDIACIADTGREMPSTWKYLNEVIQPYLESTGLKIEVVPRSFTTDGLYSKNGDLLMPAYTVTGRLGAFCSGRWKRDPIERYMRSRGVEQCELWIGYSVDEQRRCQVNQRKKWVKHRYVLIEKNLNLRGCIRLVEAAGLGTAPKSRCVMCPHQNDREWNEVLSDPILRKEAIALDEMIRANDEMGGVYVHNRRVPLTQVAVVDDFEQDAEPLFRACQESGCFT